MSTDGSSKNIVVSVIWLTVLALLLLVAMIVVQRWNQPSSFVASRAPILLLGSFAIVRLAGCRLECEDPGE